MERTTDTRIDEVLRERPRGAFPVCGEGGGATTTTEVLPYPKEMEASAASAEGGEGGPPCSSFEDDSISMPCGGREEDTEEREREGEEEEEEESESSSYGGFLGDVNVNHEDAFYEWPSAAKEEDPDYALSSSAAADVTPDLTPDVTAATTEATDASEDRHQRALAESALATPDDRDFDSFWLESEPSDAEKNVREISGIDDRDLLGELSELRTALEESEERRTLAENAFVILEGRCERYEGTLHGLERANESLKSDLASSEARSEELAAQALRLDRALREAEYESELLEEHLRNAAERIADPESEAALEREREARVREVERMERHCKALEGKHRRLEEALAERLVDAEDERDLFAAKAKDLSSLLEEVRCESERKSRGLDAAEKHQQALHDQILQLEKRVELLMEANRNSTETYEELREECRELRRESRDMEEEAGRRNAALDEQNSRLEATVDLLVEDYRNATEKLVDAEEERESLTTEVLRLDSLLRDVGAESRTKSQQLVRAAECQRALDGQNHRLEATVDLLVEDHRDAMERLVDAEEGLEASDAEIRRLESLSREAAIESRRKSRELETMAEREKAVWEQNSRLVATVDLLVRDYHNTTEELVDAEEGLEESAAKMIRLGSLSRDAAIESRRKSRELETMAEREKALWEQNFRLEATVDLLVRDYRNTTEELVDAEDARESLASVLRDVTDESRAKSKELERATERQHALEEQNSRLKDTIRRLSEDYRNTTERLVDAEDACKRESEMKSQELEKVARYCQELERGTERRKALDEQNSRLERTIDLLLEDYRNVAERLVDAEDAREYDSTAKSRELNRVAGHRTALRDQNSRLEATIELLAEDLQNATENLVDAEEELEASAEHCDLLVTELLRLDSTSQNKSQELERATQHRRAVDDQNSRLENTIDLLLEDYRNVAERLVDAEEKVAKAEFVGSNEHVFQLEEEKKLLQKELTKMTRERFQVMDRAKNCDKVHEAVVDKLNEKLMASTQQVEMLQKSMSEAAECHKTKVHDLVTEMARLSKEAEDAKSSVAELTARCDKLSMNLEAAVANLNENLKASNQRVQMLQKSMDEAAKCHAAKVSDLVTEIAELSKDADNAASTVIDLTARCDKLSVDMECSRAKNAELESAKAESEGLARNLASHSEALDAEKTSLEEKLSKLIQSLKELTLRHLESEANVQRLSGEVVFAHDEISRLTMDKEAVVEESESQLEQVTNRLEELEKENRRKSEQFQKLWSKSNTLLLEKESAMAAVKRLQQEKEQLSIGLSKEQAKLSEKAEELQNENEQQRRQIEMMMEAECILREMNTLLETEKERAVSRLSREKEAIMEEKHAIMEQSRIQWQKANHRLMDLEEENNRKSKQLEEELWTKSTALRLEKESAMATVKQLQYEKQAIIEESESKLQNVSDRLKAVEKETKHKNEKFQEMLTKSDALLLEKESAIATVKQLQQEKEQQSIGHSKERDKLSDKVYQLQSENRRQKQHIESLIEAEGTLQSDLSAKVEELQAVSSKQSKQIEVLNQAERSLQEMLKTEKEVLGMEIERLRQENTAIEDEMAVLTNAYTIEKDRMQSQEDDLTWKIKALTQNMSLRMKEKDVTISRLGKQIQGHLNEASKLKHELHMRDARKESINLNSRLPNLEAKIKDKETELDQKDMMITDLHIEIETRYKPEISRMQLKVNRMEKWLHESLSSAMPPRSPQKRSPNSQRIQESPAKATSNPQSSPKNYPDECSSTFNLFVD